MLLIVLNQILLMVSTRGQKNVLSLIRFVLLYQTAKIKICHIVASKRTEVIEGRHQLIATDVIDYKEATEDGYIDNDGSDLDEEDGSGSGVAGVRTGVNQSGTEEVEEVQWVVKYSSLSSYMLKPIYLLTQGFKNNKKAQENIFNHMCNFGAREEWRNGRRPASSYIDVDIINDQYHLVNTTPLECITGYTT